MASSNRDPYHTLGVSASAPDAEVRAAYRRLVKQHHPDHNGGSEASERRFEEVQEAYARIRELRKPRPAGAQGPAGGAQGPAGAAQGPAGAAHAPPPPRRPGQTAAPPPPPRRRGQASTQPPRQPVDPEVEARMAKLEQELREAHEARERARQAARDAAAASYQRPTDEELGYITTDDSFSKILSDARSEVSDRLSGAREHPVAQRVSDLIDELEELLTKGSRPRNSREPKA